MTRPADNAGNPAPDIACDGMAWELASLRELGDLCMRLARVSAARAEDVLTPAAGEDAGPAKGAPDPVLAFTRLSRAVRMTVGLHARIRRNLEVQAERKVAEQAVRDEAAAEAIVDRRRTGALRRAMTRFIAQTAIEAEEREASEVDFLFSALDEHLDRGRADPIDFEHVDVKRLALAICRELGVDPGADWWRDGWGVEAPAHEPATPPPR